MLIRLRSFYNTAVSEGLLPMQSKEAAEKLFQDVVAVSTTQRKTASEATPTPAETQAIGEALTPQDLESFQKILALLYNMYSQYQMSGGAGGPGMAMAQGAAAQGMMQGMDPSMMQGGMMPPGMDPSMMQGGMMPQQGMMPQPGMMPKVGKMLVDEEVPAHIGLGLGLGTGLAGAGALALGKGLPHLLRLRKGGPMTRDLINNILPGVATAGKYMLGGGAGLAAASGIYEDNREKTFGERARSKLLNTLHNNGL